jgi:hypothetical protein
VTLTLARAPLEFYFHWRQCDFMAVAKAESCGAFKL